MILELIKDDVLFWTAKKPSSTQKLDSEDCVLLADMDLHQAQKLLSASSKKNVSSKRVISSSNLEILTDLTAKGTGIGIIPKRVATRDTKLGLKPLSAELPVLNDRICLVYRADAQKTKGSQIIQTAIKKAFQ